jgi:hypothetical protein
MASLRAGRVSRYGEVQGRARLRPSRGFPAHPALGAHPHQPIVWLRATVRTRIFRDDIAAQDDTGNPGSDGVLPYQAGPSRLTLVHSISLRFWLPLFNSLRFLLLDREPGCHLCSETTRSLKSILNLAVIQWSNSRGKELPLRMPHRKLIRILNYVWLLVVFPIAMALPFGLFAHSASLGIKTFLLIECGMAVLSPLLNAVIGDDDHSRHKRGK